MTVARQFSCRPESVPRARRFVVDTLADLPRDSLDVIALMVSELATNSVLHAMTEFTVSVDRSDTEIHVAVADTGGGAPEAQWPPTGEPHGRGLHLVTELSRAWGVTPSQGRARGKTVWFTVAVSDRLNGLETAR